MTAYSDRKYSMHILALSVIFEDCRKMCFSIAKVSRDEGCFKDIAPLLSTGQLFCEALLALLLPSGKFNPTLHSFTKLGKYCYC